MIGKKIKTSKTLLGSDGKYSKVIDREVIIISKEDENGNTDVVDLDGNHYIMPADVFLIKRFDCIYMMEGDGASLVLPVDIFSFKICNGMLDGEVKREVINHIKSLGYYFDGSTYTPYKDGDIILYDNMLHIFQHGRGIPFINGKLAGHTFNPSTWSDARIANSKEAKPLRDYMFHNHYIVYDSCIVKADLDIRYIPFNEKCGFAISDKQVLYVDEDLKMYITEYENTKPVKYVLTKPDTKNIIMAWHPVTGAIWLGNATWEYVDETLEYDMLYNLDDVYQIKPYYG